MFYQSSVIQKNSITLWQETFNFMAPFYGWGSTASRLQPLRGSSLLFTTKFPERVRFVFYCSVFDMSSDIQLVHERSVAI